MRKSLLFSMFALLLLMISSIFAQGQGRRQPPPNPSGGGRAAPAMPRESPRAVPRPAPLPRNDRLVPPSRFGFSFGFRYPPYLYNLYPYYFPYYPYPYYYPYSRYPGLYERICIPGHWGYNQNGNIIWIAGYCNVPYHRHDACFYYNCY